MIRRVIPEAGANMDEMLARFRVNSAYPSRMRGWLAVIQTALRQNPDQNIRI